MEGVRIPDHHGGGAHMCYERRAWRERAEQEESRRLWDVFHRETATEAPAERPDPEVVLEDDGAEVREPTPAEH
jgi:hypothetical protein